MFPLKEYEKENTKKQDIGGETDSRDVFRPQTDEEGHLNDPPVAFKGSRTPVSA